MPHGAGINPHFPTKLQIDIQMQGRDDDFFVEIHGDGSLTDPTCWWAALGGFGAWMPNWSHEGHQIPIQNETSSFGAIVGQTGSSTRTELMAWLSVLAMPIRSNYATDSAAMLRKALRLTDAVHKHEAAPASSIRIKLQNPFGKPWAVQTDGDLWEQAWAAVSKRGAANQKLRKGKRPCHPGRHHCRKSYTGRQTRQ